MMRTMAVWISAVLMAGGLWSASVISQGLADEPAAPSSASEATGGAAGKETSGSETVPPVVEGQPALPAEAGEVQERRVPGLLSPGSGILLTPTAPLPTELAYPTVPGDTPSCTSWGANRLDCFVRGTDGIMYHAWWDGNQWADWEFRGGSLASKPSCVSWGANRIDCFARFTDHSIHHTWWDGIRWFFWENLGGEFSTGNPTCVSWKVNGLSCFARGNDGAMYHKYWNGIQWHGWESSGGVFSTADPTCVPLLGEYRVDCFARGNDGAMWHNWWYKGKYDGWKSLGGILTSDPSCVSWGGPNYLGCFARGTDNALYYKWWDGSLWHGWDSLGGRLASDPSCVSWGFNSLNCFARGTDNALWTKVWNGAQWLPWEPLGGQLASNPSCVSSRANRIHCMAQGTDINLYHRWWNGTQWLGWEGVGRVALAPFRSPADSICYLPPPPYQYPPPVQSSFPATQTILETTYRNFLGSINTSTSSWARDVVHGRGMYDIALADVLPISSAYSSHGYSQNEWTNILAPTEDYETEFLVGLSGRAIIYDMDGQLGQSGADVPFTHPFGKDWEFYIAPDAAYKNLAAPPASPPATHCEYAQSVIEAKRDFGLNVVNTLGVETDERLLPAPYRPWHGDRVAVWGRWIVDTGHPDFHTEIHPPLLLATGRVTSPDETTTTVIGRPYLVGQRFNDCNRLGHCTSNGLMDHLLREAALAGSASLMMEAHAEIKDNAWQGSPFFVHYTVKPPRPQMYPQDRLMVSFHFTVRTGVVVEVFNVGDAVSVRIEVKSNFLKRANPLPQAEDYVVTESELQALNPGEAQQVGNLYKFEYLYKALTSYGIGDYILHRGIKTTRYLAPNAPTPSVQTIHVPVNSLPNSLLVPQSYPPGAITVDDNQPWPIAGTLILTWEHGRYTPPGGAPPTIYQPPAPAPPPQMMPKVDPGTTRRLIVPRGVEGEPPASAPTGQEEKTPAPK